MQWRRSGLLWSKKGLQTREKEINRFERKTAPAGMQRTRSRFVDESPQGGIIEARARIMGDHISENMFSAF